jgi:hypothetical protein
MAATVATAATATGGQATATAIGGRAQGPILVIIDDAQWLDRESIDAIAFVARRIHAESVGILIAFRSGAGDVTGLADLRVMEVEGLDDVTALELLTASVRGPLNSRIATQIVIATGGNPLALIDLGDELSTHQLAGGALLPEPVPLGAQLEAHYQAQVRALARDGAEQLVEAG